MEWLRVCALAVACACALVPSTALADRLEAWREPFSSGLRDRGAAETPVLGAGTLVSVTAPPPESTGGLAAAAFTLPITIREHIAYNRAGRLRIEGLVRNDNAGTCEDVDVAVQWYDASNAPIGSPLVADAQCWVLPPGRSAGFAFDLVPPPGADHADIYAGGAPSALERLDLTCEFVGIFDLPGGERGWTYRVTNPKPYAVRDVLVGGWELVGPSAGPFAVLDVMRPQPFPPELGPGGSFVVDLVGENTSTVPPGEILGLGLAEARRDMTKVPVHRFHNARTGTHFYTVSEVEKGYVEAHLSPPYTYEGVAYTINTLSANATVPLYRFYNRRTGTHFYTASAVERDNVLATLSGTYGLEGVAYLVSDTDAGALVVHRFHNRRTGTHFYTASAVERDNVIATLGSVYDYEGVGFRVTR